MTISPVSTVCPCCGHDNWWLAVIVTDKTFTFAEDGVPLLTVTAYCEVCRFRFVVVQVLDQAVPA